MIEEIARQLVSDQHGRVSVDELEKALRSWDLRDSRRLSFVAGSRGQLSGVYSLRTLGDILRHAKRKYLEQVSSDEEPWSPLASTNQPFGYLSRLDLISKVFTAIGLTQSQADVAAGIRGDIESLDPFIQWVLVKEYAAAVSKLGELPDALDDLKALLAIRPWIGERSARFWYEYTGSNKQMRFWPKLTSLSGRPFSNSQYLTEWIIGTLIYEPGEWARQFELTQAEAKNMNWEDLIRWKLGIEKEQREPLLGDWKD